MFRCRQSRWSPTCSFLDSETGGCFADHFVGRIGCDLAWSRRLSKSPSFEPIDTLLSMALERARERWSANSRSDAWDSGGVPSPGQGWDVRGAERGLREESKTGVHFAHLVLNNARFSFVVAVLVLGQIACSSPWPPHQVGFISLHKTNPWVKQLVVGPDNNIWFITAAPNSLDNLIGRMTPDGTATTFPQAASWHLTINGLAIGADGIIWFTSVQRGPHPFHLIYRMSESGTITQYVISTPHAFPEGIAVSPNGSVWFAETSADRIGHLTSDGTLREYAIPHAPGTRLAPWRIAVGSDGNVWFTLNLGDAIGRITPSETWRRSRFQLREAARLALSLDLMAISGSSAKSAGRVGLRLTDDRRCEAIPAGERVRRLSRINRATFGRPRTLAQGPGDSRAPVTGLSRNFWRVTGPTNPVTPFVRWRLILSGERPPHRLQADQCQVGHRFRLGLFQAITCY